MSAPHVRGARLPAVSPTHSKCLWVLNAGPLKSIFTWHFLSKVENRSLRGTGSPSDHRAPHSRSARDKRKGSSHAPVPPAPCEALRSQVTSPEGMCAAHFSFRGNRRGGPLCSRYLHLPITPLKWEFQRWKKKVKKLSR